MKIGKIENANPFSFFRWKIVILIWHNWLQSSEQSHPQMAKD